MGTRSECMHFRSKLCNLQPKKNLKKNAIKYLDLLNIALNQILAALKIYS